MTDSIAQDLYLWMHKRRIIPLVAKQMGLDVSTLTAKLACKKNRGHLMADELIPLFDAIREVGWGKELDGLMYPYLEVMRGAERASASPADEISHLLALGQGVSTLFSCASRIPTMTDPAELRRLKIQVRTEVLPLVLQLEALLDKRLQKVTKTKKARAALPQPT